MVRKVHKLPQVILGIVAVFALMLGVFATHPQSAFAASTDDVIGIEWNADYSTCTVSQMVDSRDLKDQLHASKKKNVQTIVFTEGAGFQLDHPDWDTEGRVFRGLSELTTIQGAPRVIVGSGRSMSSMFYGCKKLQSVNLSNFNTFGVTNMAGMFEECLSLQSLDLSSFDTSQATTMRGMFNGCSSLQSLNVTSFNTSKVTNMGSNWSDGGMFAHCSSLRSLDLSSFDTSNVANFSLMFEDTDSLTEFIAGPSCKLPEDTKNLGALAMKVWFEIDASGSIQNKTENVGIYQNQHLGTKHTYISNGWHADANGWRYLASTGNWFSNGWHQIGSAWYYFQDTGYILTSGWYWIGGAWYGFWADGAMCQGWVFDNNYNDWFYCYDNGVMAASCWTWIGNAWYGFWANGTMCRGWIWDDGYGNYFYCDPWTGAMYQGCWAWLGDAWYGFWANGEMCYGWILDAGVWYYCDWWSGYMYTGWHWIGGAWYYFYANGAMACSTYVDGYWLGSNGVMW